MVSWQPDVLGTGYEQHVIELGTDPDGAGDTGSDTGSDIAAVLVRRTVRPGETVRGVALYVHGFSDYFFQTELADFAAERGLAFYALDLRKSGRARRPGQTAHYVSDLALYDAELDRTLDVLAVEHPGLPVVAVAHSTGGLILPLWLDRRRGRPSPVTVAGLVLNSPWFDLQGKALHRNLTTQALRVLGRATPLRTLPPGPTVYGGSIHTSGTGEWDFDIALKPLAGFPVTYGWLNAIRRGHARLHRGLDVGVPSLVLRSDRTRFAATYSAEDDRADTVLDVKQIARWAGCLGGETTVVPIPGARHDIFLSLPEVRKTGYARLEAWLRDHDLILSEDSGTL